MGVFNITGNNLNPQLDSKPLPGTLSLQEEMTNLYRGDENLPFEGINTIHSYRILNYNTKGYWVGMLNDAYHANTKVLIDMRPQSYRWIGSPTLKSDCDVPYQKFCNEGSDDIIYAEFNQSQIDCLGYLVEWILSYADTLTGGNPELVIGGWYLLDEPTNVPMFKYNIPNSIFEPISVYACPSETKKIYDRIKFEREKFGLNKDNSPVYIAEAVPSWFGTDTIVNNWCPTGVSGQPNWDYAKFSDSFDILMIDYYGYADNSETHLNSLGPDNGRGNLRVWNNIRNKAVNDFKLANIEDKPIHAILVMGEEKDGFITPYPLVSQELTRAAIRKVYDLGFKGIWFYKWRGTYNDQQYDQGSIHWQMGEHYENPIQTEIHRKDELIVAIEENNNTSLYKSSQEFTVQPPFNNTNIESNLIHTFFYTTVSAMESGDFRGKETENLHYPLTGTPVSYDTPFFIRANVSTNPFEGVNGPIITNADGNDEILTITSFALKYFGHYTNALESESEYLAPLRIFLCSTSGDFDGDGDYEIISAFYNLTTNSVNSVLNKKRE